MCGIHCDPECKTLQFTEGSTEEPKEAVEVIQGLVMILTKEIQNRKNDGTHSCYGRYLMMLA